LVETDDPTLIHTHHSEPAVTLVRAHKGEHHNG
jgi:hypothetical protein